MRIESWGRYPKTEEEVQPLYWRSETSLENHTTSLLPFGLGRSYGDVCLNDGGTVLSTRTLDRFIHFNEETGLLKCESGVSLEKILEHFVPRGWFVPVTPGTKFVTVGGAIANDVHGKNHHCAGTFGCHVPSFELMRSDGSILNCSSTENSELYAATIGGLGLTGLIITAEVQLRKVSGPWIDMESIKFDSIDEFFEISASSDEDFEYTVAWLDCLAPGGRGIFMRGNHSKRTAPLKKGLLQSLLVVPVDFPSFALNHLSVKAFNTLYFHKQRQKKLRSEVSYEPFFYPLDGVRGWNKIYGKRGFLQFQCVVPKDENFESTRLILDATARSGKASFLSVIKEFGSPESPGMLSFPRPGVTICLDFPFEGESTLALLKELDDITRECGGRLYPAKDAAMSPESFKSYYPKWEKFQEHIDSKFSSSFWRRVTA